MRSANHTNEDKCESMNSHCYIRFFFFLGIFLFCVDIAEQELSVSGLRILILSHVYFGPVPNIAMTINDVVL